VLTFPRKVRKRSGVMTLAVILLVGCSSAAQPGPLNRVATPVAPLVGVYEPGVPGSWSDLSEFRSRTRLTPRIVMYFSAWHEKFRSDFAYTAWRHDAYIFIKMQPNNVTLESIAAGVSDRYLSSYARAVRAFGHPVIISFAHEMNGHWYPWGAGHQPASAYIYAWRHVVRIFRDEHATNVIWVWTVNSIDQEKAQGFLRRWWPGAAWVNWVGVDGYYYRTSDSFESVFGRTIAQIRSFSSAPVMIAETAVGTTSDRQTQIAQLFASARDSGVVGVVWFDVKQNKGIYHQDWRLEDDPPASTAFRSAARKFTH
jgi:mannan endo-1,4-beta-mannosidase